MEDADKDDEGSTPESAARGEEDEVNGDADDDDETLKPDDAATRSSSTET